MDGTAPARLVTVTGDVEKLTVADIQDAARRYLDRSNYVQVVLRPETPLKVGSVEPR